jgi:FAD-linked oxidoreductase
MQSQLSWVNWAGDQRCTPAAIERPSSAEDVVHAVERAAERDQVLRVAGAGHSFTDAVLTDGRLLSLERMNRILDVDSGSGLVRAEAGITIHELSLRLAGHGLALANLGDIDVQSVAGAISTATHGSGGRMRNVSSFIEAVELVDGRGNVVHCGRDDDADLWRAARVGVGALGVISAVTVQAVPAFTLCAVDKPAKLEETLDSIEELVDANDHFEFFAFPHSPLALTRTFNRVADRPKPPSRAGAYINDIVLNNHAYGLVCRAGRRFPRQIPRLNRLVSRLSGSRTVTDASYEVFASPRLVRFTEMEYAIPREQAAAAVREVFAMVESEGFAVPFPIEVRFLEGDDAFLSTAHERATCYIAVHMYDGMEWEPYFRAVEAIMDRREGRPHWGKRHFQTSDILRSRYPQWDAFATQRQRLDPDGRFVNDYVQRVLGPVPAVVASA